MTDNILNLKGEAVEHTVLPNYDVSLLEHLERAIAEVKAGRVSGLAVILVVPPTHAGENEQIDVSWQGRKLTLLAAASRLVFRLNLVIDRDSASS